MFSTLGGSQGLQNLLGQLQVFRQLPRSSHHRRPHRLTSAAPRPQAAKATSAPILCEESLNQVLTNLEESGNLATLIRDCESELVPCLSSTPEAKIAFAASSRGKKVPPPPAPPLPFPPPSSISPTYLSSGEFMRDLDGLSSCSSPPSSSGRPCTGLAVLNSALFARTLNNVQFQIARGFKSKRHKDGGSPFRKSRPEEKSPSSTASDTAGIYDKTILDSTKEEREKALHDFMKKMSSSNESTRSSAAPAASSLTTEEQAKIMAALHGFSEGVRAKGEGPAAKSPPAAAPEGGSGAKTKTPFNFWEKVNKLASVLVIIAILISLSQIFNVPILRMNKGANEISPEDIDVTFDDVRGCDEAKQELTEIVDFLMNPEKYSALGGKLPKGCLLVGPPGTGKTRVARAVAGQAGVPFFHASGSEFDEVLVGQGARRVRDLFRAAKQRAPCVIFIDEIDTVGSKRTSSVLHPYANQTINQLLSEMDGFVTNEGVIVLGATNRAEELDRALLRPGRFDTRVTVPKPDMKGRKDILELYLGKIKHDASVDIDKLAKMTVGFSGADLENVVNTAAIRAAVEGKEWVTMSEFEYSHDKHVLGTDWKSRVRDREDLRITAYHEAGHTLVAFFTTDSKPLHKVTIVAKGTSGGHTAFLPERDSYHETRSQFLASMDVSMGGRAAEELIFGKEKVTGGASADLQSATSIAELMVKKLGMSEKIGLRVFADGPTDPAMAAAGLSVASELGPGTAELIDAEVNRMLDESYKRAAAILRSHRSELDLLAEALLHYETLDAEDIRSIIDGDKGGRSALHKWLSQKNSVRKLLPLPSSTGEQPPTAGPGAAGGAGGGGGGGGIKAVPPRHPPGPGAGHVKGGIDDLC